jgi:hypothetical protein
MTEQDVAVALRALSEVFVVSNSKSEDRSNCLAFGHLKLWRSLSYNLKTLEHVRRCRRCRIIFRGSTPLPSLAVRAWFRALVRLKARRTP